jgi:hypothetical protein
MVRSPANTSLLIGHHKKTKKKHTRYIQWHNQISLFFLLLSSGYLCRWLTILFVYFFYPLVLRLQPMYWTETEINGRPRCRSHIPLKVCDMIIIENTNPTKNLGWTQVLRKGKQFLLHLWQSWLIYSHKPANQSTVPLINLSMCKMDSLKIWKSKDQKYQLWICCVQRVMVYNQHVLSSYRVVS